MQNIEKLIFNIRGCQVMIDFHLSKMYGVQTKRLNEQVKRNLKRFPDSFMFQLTAAEWENLQFQITVIEQHNFLRSHFATLENQRGRHRKFLPYVFTEQGVAMLSAVLKSDIAIETSILIMQAFVKTRAFLIQNASLFQRLEQVELKQFKTDEKLSQIFKALEAARPEPNHGIFFDGQVFDAYVFVSDIIKKANNEIVLIDNYIDESTLTFLAKKEKQVKVLVYTKNIGKQLQLDLRKANEQYGNTFNIRELKGSHDRFLIIDRSELYHIGASLKDLGKKWFAFSKLDENILQIMFDQINNEVV